MKSINSNSIKVDVRNLKQYYEFLEILEILNVLFI